MMRGKLSLSKPRKQFIQVCVPQPGISLVTPIPKLYSAASTPCPVQCPPGARACTSCTAWPELPGCSKHTAPGSSGCSRRGFNLCCKLVRTAQHQTCNIRPDVEDDVISTAHNPALGQHPLGLGSWGFSTALGWFLPLSH